MEENVVVEWRRAYINYRGLKKVIKRVDARRTARISRDLSRSPSKSSSKRALGTTFDGIRRRASGRNDGNDGDDNDHYISTSRKRRNYGGTGRGAGLTDDEEEDTLPRVTLDGTGLALASTDDMRRKGGIAMSDITKVSSGEDGNANKQTSHTKQDSDIEANALPAPESRSGSDFTQTSGGKPNIEEPHSSDELNAKPKKGKKAKRKGE